LPRTTRSRCSRGAARRRAASFADLTEQLAAAVVNISTRQKCRWRDNNPFAGTPFADLFGGRARRRPATREAQSLGSGFIISADGYVVTNNHVVTADGRGEIESITVTMPDGTEYPAKLIGRDAASDLAVLKITAGQAAALRQVRRFAQGARRRLGDRHRQSVRAWRHGDAGIVSAVYRNTGAGGAYDRYLQTDASINRGNSGGPMFDMKGQVIGINNAIFSPTGGSVGIGFAIPAEIAAPIVDKLIKGEAIERGYLGVRIQPLTEDVADSLGLPTTRANSSRRSNRAAAANAGIQPGDVVVKVDGKEVSPDQTLSYIVANTAPGKRIPIELIRNGKRMTLTRPSPSAPARRSWPRSSSIPNQPQGNDQFNKPQRQGEGLAEKSLGLSVLPMNPQIAGQLGVPDTPAGW
jgi:serine protease Do